jgi:membrane protease YdiL (CAAX protease family)
VVIFAGVVLVSYIVCAGVIGPIVAWTFRVIGLSGVSNEPMVSALALLVATGICLTAIDKRPWSDVWLDAGAARPRLILLGFAIGALAIGLPIVALIGGGWLREMASAPGSWWGATIRVSALLIPAALSEELFTRGYIMSVLRESWGWPWAIAATSIGFGLLHLKNPGATAESISMVILAGVFLASVVYSTRSLYAAWAAHFAWNWVMAAIFHAYVSGLPLESPGYRYVDAGPDWATGGAWGPEGGIPAALGMAGGIALLVSRRRARGTGPGARINKTQENA